MSKTKKYEQKIEEVLAELVDAEEIVVRHISDGYVDDDGYLRYDNGQYTVDEIDYAALERLTARGLAERVIEKRIHVTRGTQVLERFIPTDAGVLHARAVEVA